MRHLIFVLAISSVFAQNKSELAEKANQHFLRLDLYPKDGVLEINELTTKFTDLDTDGNGKLTFAEYEAHAIDDPMRHQLFNHFDTNKDRFLTKVELVDKIFNEMNVNGDNQVTKNEFVNYFSNMTVCKAHETVTIQMMKGPVNT